MTKEVVYQLFYKFFIVVYMYGSVVLKCRSIVFKYNYIEVKKNVISFQCFDFNVYTNLSLELCSSPEKILEDFCFTSFDFLK